MAIKQNFPDIKPSLNLDFANTKSLDPRIDFTRASTATYYDGKTFAKAEENLFKYSQELDDGAWSFRNGGAVIADQTVAPDGTSTAYLFYASSSGIYRLGRQDDAPASRTVSIFAKAAGINILGIGQAAFSGNFSYFDLANGTVLSQSGITDSVTINDVGDGWYRCRVTFSSSQTDIRFILSDSGSFSVTANGTDGIFIWGAQLEQRDQVTAYTPTTDQPITNYIPVLQTASANVPRFDHDPITGESKGLLIEEQRTNEIIYSEDFSDSSWENERVSVSVNEIVAPDGSLTGNKITANVGTSTYYSIKWDGPSDSVGRYKSVYVKKSTSRYIAFNVISTVPSINYKLFDFDTKSIIDFSNDSRAGINYQVQSVGNGWFRISFFSGHDSSTSDSLHIILVDDNDTANANSWDSDGTASVYVWGAQAEAGSFPTSYIKTEASQVTRVADSASVTAGAVGTLLEEDTDGTWTDSATAAPEDTITLSSSQRVYQYPRTLTQTEIDAVTGA